MTIGLCFKDYYYKKLIFIFIFHPYTFTLLHILNSGIIYKKIELKTNIL